MTHDHRPHAHDHPSRPNAAGHAAHQHARGHSHASTSAPTRSLAVALALTTCFLLVEAVAGWLAGSLALLSDAGHMLTDAGALALALLAQRLAATGPSARNTYGLRRAEILAALLNGVVLGASSLWIVAEAVARWSTPRDVKGGWVLVVATLGLAVNLASAWALGRGERNANVRAALAHVLADAAGSVAAMAAGAVVHFTGWTRADAVASVLVSVLIAWSAWRLVRDSTGVLLEGTPAGVELASLDGLIRATPGVVDAHDLHVWAISDGFPVLTVHVVLAPDAHGVEVARAVGDRLRAAGIEHATVQPEARPQALRPADALLPRGRRAAGESAREPS